MNFTQNGVRGVNRHRNFGKQYVESVSQTDQLTLIGYADIGFFPKAIQFVFPVEPVPEFQDWEDVELIIYTAALSKKFQTHYYFSQLTAGHATSSDLENSFSYAYLSCLIDVHILNLNEQRYGFKRDSNALEMITPFIPLGFLSGEGQRAEKMARLAIKASQNGWMSYRQYPMFTFMLSLLSDYLDETPSEFLGKAASAKDLQELLVIWEHPDPEQIKDLCMLACDFHIQRCRNNSVKGLFEFSDLFFTSGPLRLICSLNCTKN